MGTFIINILKGVFGKAQTILIILLVGVCAWLYYQTSSLEKESIQQFNQIVQLSGDLAEERQRSGHLEALNQQMDEIIQKQRSSELELLEKRNEILARLEEIDNANTTKDDPADSLDPTLIRLLDSVCASVRGKDCPSPNS